MAARASVSIILALTVAVVTTASASAGCYGANTGAGTGLVGVAAAKGVQTTQQLEPATPISGATLVHPVQIVNQGSVGDFVAMGTFHGVGTNGGGSQDCATVISSRWAVYVDGRAFTTYFCRAQYGSTDADAADQHVEVIHTSCDGTQWVFKWNSNVKTCQTVSGAGGLPAVGGESPGDTSGDIDVRDQELRYRILGGTWTAWQASDEASCADAAYGITTFAADDKRYHD